MTQLVRMTAINSVKHVIEEAVKMNGPIPVMFRHKYIFQPTTADIVIKPMIQVARDLFWVVPVDFLRAQSKRHKPPEIIAKGEVTDSRFCPPFRAL